MGTPERPVILSPVADPDGLATAIENELPDVDPIIARTFEESCDHLADARIALTTSFLSEHTNDELFQHAPNLRWLQTLTAGVDGYDLDRLESQNVVVTSASGIHAEPIAQQVIGYMIAFDREFPTAFRHQQQRLWHRFEGDELTGKVVGILGVGSIGERIAELAKAFRMETIGTKRTISEDVSNVDRLYLPKDQHKVIAEADYLVVACPLTPETRKMITASTFDDMKPDSVLINIGRGQIVDQSDLVKALKNGKIDGAALDVFTEEPLPANSDLWDLPNVILTPHMAGSTSKYWTRCAAVFSENHNHFQRDNKSEMINRVL